MKRIISLMLVVLSIFAFVGCGKSEPNVAVKDIITNVESEVEAISNLTEVDLKAEEISELNKGVVEAFNFNLEDIEEGIIKFPMINLQADEVIILKLKDETKAADIEEALQKHVENQLQAFENYVPKNYELVKNHIFKTNGKYVLFVVSEEAEKIEGIFDNALK